MTGGSRFGERPYRPSEYLRGESNNYLSAGHVICFSMSLKTMSRYVFKLNIRCKGTKKYCNYALIRKKIFLKGRILRSFEVLMPHQSVIMPSIYTLMKVLAVQAT